VYWLQTTLVLALLWLESSKLLASGTLHPNKSLDCP
jgi:hypothetical protein